ncbi:RNA-binding cell elongation regulator Jag/EloR [uncultured Agathobaculum sp.]|uniref:RNA-binding cell elongation regulator Jag/EloR n=1 Tax=uncultured Agathobaculum sp. TaxID=2048140 RepID=UPI00296F934C
MQKFLEATGENRDAAVANALKQLGLERDDVSVEVLEIGKKGFLGIGATPARVRVTYEAPDLPEAKPEVKHEERKPAPKAEPKQAKPAPKAEKPAEKPQKLSITTDDTTPRLVKAAPADFVPEKLEFERPPRRERSDRPRRERSDRSDRNGRDRRPRRPREERPITPSVPKERELIPVSEAGMQQAEKLAVDFIVGLLAKMGVEGQVKTLPQTECDQLRLEIFGPDMGPIIGRRGDTLDAIQYLGSLVLNNALEEHVRLSVDTENYREKRAESLERLARKMAMKVVKAHRSMTLEPMNPYERRIIHAALQDFNGVTTYSTGTEPGRRVVIAPDNSYRSRERG